MKRIATHKSPDADAIVAAWLAEHYLFAGEAVEVVFLSWGATANAPNRADCILDMTNTYDPERLLFDHKPPAFLDRNASCATRLVWEHLLSVGEAVEHLADLIAVVH